jgi:hypothetical protein
MIIARNVYTGSTILSSNLLFHMLLMNEYIHFILAVLDVVDRLRESAQFVEP